MADIAVLILYPTTGPSPLQTGALGHAVHGIDCYDLTTVDLRRYAVLVVPSTVDQEFLARNRDLLDRSLIEHFYSRELIRSDSARGTWTVPDLRPLPAY